MRKFNCEFGIKGLMGDFDALYAVNSIAPNYSGRKLEGIE